MQATFSLRGFPKPQPAMGRYATEIRSAKSNVAFSNWSFQHNPARVGDSDLGVQVRLLPFTETSEV